MKISTQLKTLSSILTLLLIQSCSLNYKGTLNESIEIDPNLKLAETMKNQKS